MGVRAVDSRLRGNDGKGAQDERRKGGNERVRGVVVLPRMVGDGGEGRGFPPARE